MEILLGVGAWWLIGRAIGAIRDRIAGGPQSLRELWAEMQTNPRTSDGFALIGSKGMAALVAFMYVIYPMAWPYTMFRKIKRYEDWTNGDLD